MLVSEVALNPESSLTPQDRPNHEYIEDDYL